MKISSHPLQYKDYQFKQVFLKCQDMRTAKITLRFRLTHRSLSNHFTSNKQRYYQHLSSPNQSLGGSLNHPAKLLTYSLTLYKLICLNLCGAGLDSTALQPRKAAHTSQIHIITLTIDGVDRANLNH